MIICRLHRIVTKFPAHIEFIFPLDCKLVEGQCRRPAPTGGLRRRTDGEESAKEGVEKQHRHQSEGVDPNLYL